MTFFASNLVILVSAVLLLGLVLKFRKRKSERRHRHAAKQGPLPLGKRLAKLRKERSMSLQSLANETGLTASYIAQIEKGKPFLRLP